MSAAAAATTTTPKHNLIEGEVLEGMPPTKRPAVQQCNCAKCALCYEIFGMVRAALEILNANTESDTSTADEEKLRRLARLNIGRSEGCMRVQLEELLPGDPRRQTRTELAGFNMRHFMLRQDYHEVREQCDTDAELSSRAMFQQFHGLLQRTLSRLQHRMRFSSMPTIDETFIESGTMCLVVMHNCTGIVSCRALYDQLRAIAAALQAAIGELKVAPLDYRCITTHRLHLPDDDDDDDDSGTDVDTIPGEVAQAADAVVVVVVA